MEKREKENKYTKSNSLVIGKNEHNSFLTNQEELKKDMKNKLIFGSGGNLLPTTIYDKKIGETPHHLLYSRKNVKSNFMLYWALFSTVVGVIVYLILETKV